MTQDKEEQIRELKAKKDRLLAGYIKAINEIEAEIKEITKEQITPPKSKVAEFEEMIGIKEL